MSESVIELPAAIKNPKQLFQFSGYVHVGSGVEECELTKAFEDLEAGTPDVKPTEECDNPEHFHCWVCLPNAFQVKDIGEKARAAKARKLRALKDSGRDGNPATDSHVTLEAEMDSITELDRERLTGEVVSAYVGKDLSVILNELSEKEEFEDHDQDVEESRRLMSTPDDEKTQEEVDQVEGKLKEFGEAFESEVKGREANKKAELDAMNRDEFVEVIRKKRIEDLSVIAYNNTNYEWMMFSGTRLATKHNTRKFMELKDLRGAPPEVVSAIRVKIRQLENAQSGGDASGN
jgi:hypothetical protein